MCCQSEIGLKFVMPLILGSIDFLCKVTVKVECFAAILEFTFCCELYEYIFTELSVFYLTTNIWQFIVLWQRCQLNLCIEIEE